MEDLKPSFEIILGCMFSGKSTELIRRISRYQSIGVNVLCINHSYDTRTGNSIQTHEGKAIPAIKSSKLMSVIDRDDFKRSSVIGVDESQFFEDLLEFSKYVVDQCKKTLIICGLDGDFKRNPIGQILQCIPLCDKVEKLNALDMVSKDGSSASFTMRISKTDIDQVSIGGSDKYLAVSRENYLNNNA